MSEINLHGHWRSSASYRVRIVLNLKGLDYAEVDYDLRAAGHADPAYRAIAPHGLVPTLEHDGMALIEGPAIIEWIEARWPSPQLLPEALDAAAIVRAMAALIACDIHPLNNLRVVNKLRSDFGATSAQIKAWAAHWVGSGFTALETLISRHGDGFAFGDRPTLADCYLVPQIYNAERFSVDLSPFPRIVAAGQKAQALPAFLAAFPENQPAALK